MGQEFYFDDFVSQTGKEAIMKKKSNRMKAGWLALILCLAVLLSACGREPTPAPPDSSPTASDTDASVETPSGPVTEPTTEPVTEPVTEPPTEPQEKVYTLADLKLADIPKNGGGVYKSYYAFLYDPDDNYRPWGESAAKKIEELTPGYVYVLDWKTESIIRILDEPATGLDSITRYVFCITETNKLVVTDYKGEFYLVLYEAEEPLVPTSVDYREKTLYFIEGDRILNMDLITGQIKQLIEYEGALEVFHIENDEEFPHLMVIRTASGDVAWNMETGETAIIPETGPWGTAAFDLYMGFGEWPEDVE